MRPETQAELRIDDAYLRIMCEVLEEHGIDSRDVLARAGLPRRLPDRETTTSAEASIAFRRAFVAVTERRRELWSIVAGRLGLRTSNPYGPAMRTARDIESVVRLLEQGDLYLALMSVVPLRDADRRLVGVEFDVSAAPPDLRAYEEVISVTAHIRSWDSIWAGAFPYRRMELPVSLALDAVRRQNHSGIVRTTSRPRLHWHPEVSTRPLPGSSEYLHQRHVRDLTATIEQLRRSRGIRDRIVDRLRGPGGASCTVGQLAREFGTSTRSLQRALAGQGLTFRALQDSVKRDVATSRLRDTSAPIAEIAMELGYTSPTSFSDAFRHWFGLSPSRYRAGERG